MVFWFSLPTARFCAIDFTDAKRVFSKSSHALLGDLRVSEAVQLSHIWRFFDIRGEFKPPIIWPICYTRWFQSVWDKSPLIVDDYCLRNSFAKYKLIRLTVRIWYSRISGEIVTCGRLYYQGKFNSIRWLGDKRAESFGCQYSAEHFRIHYPDNIIREGAVPRPRRMASARAFLNIGAPMEIWAGYRVFRMARMTSIPLRDYN